MNGLSEKDIMVDLLNDTKLASDGYHLAMLESASDNVWNTFLRLHNDELTGARVIFNLMHQRGWYPVEPAAHTGSVYQQQTTGQMGTF
ncbi:MAG TPA: spore coat protein [Spirochaetia bacterium]|nr:spore coat protein [Spirochaetia bacterium]